MRKKISNRLQFIVLVLFITMLTSGMLRADWVEHENNILAFKNCELCNSSSFMLSNNLQFELKFENSIAFYDEYNVGFQEYSNIETKGYNPDWSDNSGLKFIERQTKVQECKQLYSDLFEIQENWTPEMLHVMLGGCDRYS